MGEMLTAKRVNGIKNGFWSAAKKDELIQRLGQYEETGLSPDEVKRIISYLTDKHSATWVAALNCKGKENARYNDQG